MSDRTYRLSIGNPDSEDESEEIVIEPPFAIEFRIVRNCNPAANIGFFRLYNTESSKRNQISKDRFKPDQWRRITFSAGFGDVCPLIFQGNISEATTHREEADIVTEIRAYEGAYDMVNSHTSGVCGDSTMSSLIEMLAADLKKTQGTPIIGNFDDVLERRNTALFGNTWDLLMEYTGGRCFIDNGRLLVLNDNEAIEGDVPSITEDMGIQYDSLKHAEDMIEVDLLFEPRLIVGQEVGVETLVPPEPGNERYMIQEIVHNATLSQTEGAQWLTKVTLQRKRADLEIIQGGGY